MKDNFERCLRAVLMHEGGFVNHPRDPGGMTNLGVTKKVWEEWLKREVSEAEMRSLTPQGVAPMYKARYWDATRCDDLPVGLDYLVFDTAVNSGVGRATRFLQTCANVAVDGVIGPRTISAINIAPPERLIADYSRLRMEFLTGLPTWDAFGKGWSRRLVDVAVGAYLMTGA